MRVVSKKQIPHGLKPVRKRSTKLLIPKTIRTTAGSGYSPSALPCERVKFFISSWLILIFPDFCI
jgi:hypothetical protein